MREPGRRCCCCTAARSPCSPMSCWPATSPPTSPTRTAGPRPAGSWPGNSTRPTTGPPPTRSPGCAFDHPTLIVWGQDDPHFGPEWGRRLLADIPGAVGLELLPDTGHLLMEERPDELARLLLDFLTQQP